jgi:hypothetical protein
VGSATLRAQILVSVLVSNVKNWVHNGWVGAEEPVHFVRLVDECFEILSWPDFRGGSHLLDRLQSCTHHG